jgi:hypothetical protein
LVASFTEVLTRLEACDALGTAALMQDLVAQVQATPSAGEDPRVLAMYATCVEAAQRLTSSIAREIRGQARGARANSAYGAEP